MDLDFWECLERKKKLSYNQRNMVILKFLMLPCGVALKLLTYKALTFNDLLNKIICSIPVSDKVSGEMWWESTSQRSCQAKL